MNNMTLWQQEWRLAMIYASLFWPGTTISDGAFDVLRQVAEYQKKQQRKRKRRRR